MSRRNSITIVTYYFCIKWCAEDVVNHDVGWKIGLIKWNVLSYADDIVLMAPFLKGLQKLIHILGESIKNVILKVNVKKSKYIVQKKYNLHLNYMMK